MGIFLAILSSIGIGVGNVLLKRSFKDFSPAISYFIFAVLSVLFWATLGLFLGVQFQNHLIDGFVIGLISAVLSQLVYIYVLSKGELSITSTLLATYPIYTIILSLFFNHEHLTPLEAVFIGLSILGTIIICLPDKFHKEELKKLSFIILAIVGAASVGSGDVFAKNLINRTTVGTFLFWVAMGQLLSSLIYLKFANEKLGQFKEIINKFNDYKFAIYGSLTLVLGTMFLFLSYNFTFAQSPLRFRQPIQQ